MKESKIPKFRRCVLQNFPFIEEDFDALTDYELLCKVVQYLNMVIDKVNDLSKIEQEFSELKSYVENYFANLDVQDEINVKLEDMAESGDLATIIAEFLELAPVFGYLTISDMASATNLSNGSIARVLGNSSAADGDGAFYHVREKESGESADGVYKVAIGDDLIADRIADGNLNAAVSDINLAIDDVNEEINKINNRKTHDIKFVRDNENYDPTFDLTSDYNGLSFEMLKQINGNFPSIQGCALWRKTGQIIYNNSTEIYTMSNAAHPTKTILQSGNYGHGGDCCILRDNMFIGDGDSNTIIRVNLNSGNTFTYVLDTDTIKNQDHPTYTPVLSGVCIADGTSKIYCLVVDQENEDHSIKSGATVRVFEYVFATGVTTKLFEYTQDICYGQGITRDDQYFFIAGNKPFTAGGNYSGNIITIVNAETGVVFDKIENNSDYEFEGLDYGATNGITGLITSCAKYGTRCRYGIYAYYGNVSKQRTLFNNYTSGGYTWNAYGVRTRGGMARINFKIEGTFEAGQTYTFANFFNNAFPLANGGGSISFAPIPLGGYTRAFDGYAEWDYARQYGESGENDLKVLVRSGSPDSSVITGSIVYPSC